MNPSFFRKTYQGVPFVLLDYSIRMIKIENIDSGAVSHLNWSWERLSYNAVSPDPGLVKWYANHLQTLVNNPLVFVPLELIDLSLRMGNMTPEQKTYASFLCKENIYYYWIDEFTRMERAGSLTRMENLLAAQGNSISEFAEKVKFGPCMSVTLKSNKEES